MNRKQFYCLTNGIMNREQPATYRYTHGIIAGGPCFMYNAFMLFKTEPEQKGNPE